MCLSIFSNWTCQLHYNNNNNTSTTKYCRRTQTISDLIYNLPRSFTSSWLFLRSSGFGRFFFFLSLLRFDLVSLLKQKQKQQRQRQTFGPNGTASSWTNWKQSKLTRDERGTSKNVSFVYIVLVVLLLLLLLICFSFLFHFLLILNLFASISNYKTVCKN